MTASERGEFGEASHGVSGWPFGRCDQVPPLPSILPNGEPWPLLRVLVLGTASDGALAATLASIERQDHPNVHCDRFADGPSILADRDADWILAIQAGDLLAPGALAALALQAALAEAEVVAGLRVLFDGGVLAVDALAQPTGPMRAILPSKTAGETPTIGGDCLLNGEAVRQAGGFDPSADDPMTGLWNRLAARGTRFSRVGRPVLLHRYRREAMPPAPPGRSIVALTDTGYTAGAGIAHRRLSEALGLANHHVRHLRLDAESPPAAAEWVDAFPRTEAAIAAGGHDLVLAGNIHGATRSIDLLGRLSRHLPVAVILHDLFPLTGRCAFPQNCLLLATGCDARCPTPNLYPQLPRARIAEAYAGKRAVLAAPNAPILLANSTWTAQTARTIAPSGTIIAEMDLAFPTGVFRPGDRVALRQRLGLPQDDLLVMFAAVIVDAPGKGFADLSAALKTIARPGIRFVAAGRLDDPSVFGLPDLIATGPIGEEAVLAEWYGACDVYVTASQSETLGQTPIEAGLCGTPTVAYRSCGLTTAVIDGVSGLLAPTEVPGLVRTLERLIADDELRRNLGAWGRIALENRNSYAAAALRMHEVLEPRLDPVPSADGARIRFSPDLMRYFAFSARRYGGNAETLHASTHPLMRRLRRLKHRLMGRDLPLWLRRFRYLASRLGRDRAGPA